MAEKVAATATASAAGIAGWGWLAPANDVATLIVTIIAGLGAIAAFLYHLEGWRQRRADRLKEKE